MNKSFCTTGGKAIHLGILHQNPAMSELIRYFSLLLFLTILTPGQAQSTEIKLSSPDRQERYVAGLPVLSPVIFPVYTPEMGFTVAAGGLLTFKTKRNNEYLSHSTFPFIAGISTRGSVIAMSDISTFWFDDRLKMDLKLSYRNREDNYWGVGIENGLDVEQGELTTQYDAAGYEISPEILVRIRPKLYAGVMLDLVQFKATNIAPLMLEDPYVLGFGMEVFSSGLGLTAQFDTRESVVNPQSGVLLKASVMQYDDFLGSDFEFRQFSFDYRQYLNVIRNGSTLAWRYHINLQDGNVPWNMMSTVGGFLDMRGYYTGQFRDRSKMSLIIEYRHKFFGYDAMEPTRHGVTFWLGAATVFPNPQSIKQSLINMGFGYRFEIQPGSNVRIDLGFGTESVGIYMGFHEAF